jgi:glucose/arabinose dehydrogenase
MTDTGGVPSDNPFPGSYVYAYGLRNGWGMNFDPRTGWLWATDNGPACNDELNIIIRGANYGWGPHQTCTGLAPHNTNQDGPNPVRPRSYYTPTVAPTGVAFCEDCGLGGSSNGTLLYGRLNTGEVNRVVLGPNRFGVLAETTLVRLNTIILSLEVGPDKAIYFSTSNSIYKLVAT